MSTETETATQPASAAAPANALNRSKNPLDYDFTDTEALARYVTETGRILPRKYTHLTARQQRHITKTVKRARSMLLMK